MAAGVGEREHGCADRRRLGGLPADRLDVVRLDGEDRDVEVAVDPGDLRGGGAAVVERDRHLVVAQHVGDGQHAVLREHDPGASAQADRRRPDPLCDGPDGL